MFAALDRIRLKLFLGFALVAAILLIAGNAMPNWSHGNVTVSNNKLLPRVQYASAKWSPWTVCVTQVYAGQTCIPFNNNLQLGINLSNVTVSAGGAWSSVQATRAFTVMSAIFGLSAVLLAIVSFFKTLSLKQELIITSLSFAAAFTGFLSMCIWASYANTDQIEFGSAYALIATSWILFLIAGVVGNWERFDGVPEVGKRFISLGVSFVVFVGTIVAAALPAWLHQAVVISFGTLSFVYNSSFGLFQTCVTVLALTTKEVSLCHAWANTVVIQTPLGPISVAMPSGQLSEVRASQAFAILAILFSFTTFVAVAIGFWQRDDNGRIARFRVPLMGITVFWSVMTMILWADLFRKDASQDLEYGAGFAVNIFVWITGLLWIVGVYTKGSGGATATAGVTGGGYGYVGTAGAGEKYTPGGF